MTFDSTERSVEGGRPVRLYEFALGTLRWRYTSIDRPVTYGFEEYESAAISDDGLRQTGQTSADEFTVTAPSDNRVARMFRMAPPATEISLIVRDLHYGEAEARVYFTGIVRGVRRREPQAVGIICQSDLSSIDRQGLRLGWERQCTHTLYDHGCKASPGLHAYPSVVTAVTDLTIDGGSWGVGDGFFSGGYVEFPIGSGEYDRRGVQRHVGTVLVLIGGTDGIASGSTVTAYPGCSRDIGTCNTRFSNKDNYGGFPHIPGKSPFDGTPVF